MKGEEKVLYEKERETDGRWKRERERWEAQERKNRRDHRQERNLTRILDTVLGEKEKKGTSQIGNLGN